VCMVINKWKKLQKLYKGISKVDVNVLFKNNEIIININNIKCV
jgi:hypothetical protein